MQPHVENRLRLRLAEPVALGTQAHVRGQSLGARRDLARAPQHLRHRSRRPAAREQRAARLHRARRGFDQRDDRIDVGQRHRQTFEHMGALARSAQIVDRAARDHLAPMTQERFQHLAQRQQPRLPVDQRHHVDAEHRLHRRLRVEVVEHDLGHFAALELDHHAHAVLVGLIAQLRDAFDLLVAHQLGDALEQPRLVHLVRQLGDDDRLTALRSDPRTARAHGSRAGRGRSCRRSRSPARR